MPFNLQALPSALRRRKLLSLAAVLSLAFSAGAQAVSTKIYFTGGAPYSDDELAAVVGLHSGQLFTDKELQAGSQRLIDTGLFDSAALTATGSGPTRQARYTIKITPLDKLLQPNFENFVWFGPGELDTALRARVPLYRGLLPDSGNLADSVQVALAAMLKEKGVQATLSHAVLEPTTQHPVRAVNFRVETPAVRIADVHLSLAGSPEATAQLAPLVKASIPHIIGSSFKEGVAAPTLDDLVLAPVREAGYIASSLDVTSRNATMGAYGYAVTVAARISAGDAYKVSAITWEPTPVYSAADFAREAKLHPGDLASAKSLGATEDSVLERYLRLGYMDAYLAVTPALDTTAHTVAYTIKAVPGEPYHLNTVAAVGLTPAQQAEFDKGWTMKHGDPYSGAYVAEFLHNNTALRSLNGLGGSFQASADPQTHLVDLTITFVPMAHTR